MRLSRNSGWLFAAAIALLAAPAAAQDNAPSPFIQKLPSITDDAAVDEPDYTEVAADARKIAGEIEDREIEGHMDDASGGLAAHDAPAGYAGADEAYLDMKEMIKFAEAAAGSAGAACKFKLEIKLGMNMGNTLGQLGAGTMPGMSGLSGPSGNGASGQSGGGQNFGLYGPDQFGDKSSAKSRMLGDRKARSEAAPEGPSDVAGNVDEVAAEKKTDTPFDASGGARVLEEYRGQIDRYFRRLAEEEGKP